MFYLCMTIAIWLWDSCGGGAKIRLEWDISDFLPIQNFEFPCFSTHQDIFTCLHTLYCSDPGALPVTAVSSFLNNYPLRVYVGRWGCSSVCWKQRWAKKPNKQQPVLLICTALCCSMPEKAFQPATHRLRVLVRRETLPSRARLASTQTLVSLAYRRRTEFRPFTCVQNSFSILLLLCTSLKANWS